MNYDFKSINLNFETEGLHELRVLMVSYRFFWQAKDQGMEIAEG